MKRRAQVWTLGAAILAVCITFGGSLFAAEGGHRFQVGVRPGIIGSDGEPSNDMPMVGVYGRYRLDTGWLAGIALDFSEFDFERPNRLLGLSESEETDVLAEGIYVTVFAEREFMLDSERMRPYWVSPSL